MTPSIFARINFYLTEDGGRLGPTPKDTFGCLLQVEKTMNDCRLLLTGIGSVSPGQTVEVPIAFLSPSVAVGRLPVGTKFHLWDGRIVADGEVLEIL